MVDRGFYVMTETALLIVVADAIDAWYPAAGSALASNVWSKVKGVSKQET